MKKLLANFEEYVCFVLFLGMLALTFANVVSRYFLTSSISYTEEITTSSFVLLSLLGTAIATKYQAHIGLTVLTERMSEQKQNILTAIGNLLGSVFSLILFVTGIAMVNNQYQLKQISIALQWPEWIYGSFLPFGAFCMTLRFIQATWKYTKMIKFKEVG